MRLLHPGSDRQRRGAPRRDPDPTRDEVKAGLRRNLCRCTGYAKIIDAVQLAGRFRRGEASPADFVPDPDDAKIGVSHPRPSAYAKACGTAMFGGDIRIPGALEIAVVRSPHGHAVIRGIDASAAERMPGVVGVMTAADIKGTNRLKYTLADRPILCDDKVRTLGDAVAIVAAQTRDQALAAVDAVVVDYEPLPVMTSPDQALAEGAPQIHPDTPNLVLPAADHQGRRRGRLRAGRRRRGGPVHHADQPPGARWSPR